MRGAFVWAMALVAVMAGLGCAAKIRRTVCFGAALDCECSTSVTSDTRTFDCSVAAHPGWSCCQSASSTLCTCRMASCPPTQMSVDDCRVSSAAAAELVSTPICADAGCPDR
jgi:hypothetical protein